MGVIKHGSYAGIWVKNPEKPRNYLVSLIVLRILKTLSLESQCRVYDKK